MTCTQCRLRRGNVQQTAFIPSRFAVQGETLRIATGAGKARRWQTGWIVEAVGQQRDRDAVIGIERAYERSGVRSPVRQVDAAGGRP